MKLGTQIEKCVVNPWYNKVSLDTYFPVDTFSGRKVDSKR